MPIPEYDTNNSNEFQSSHHGQHERGPAQAPGVIVAPMSGRIVKVFTENGTRVKKDDPILVLEAMKMEVLSIPSDKLQISKHPVFLFSLSFSFVGGIVFCEVITVSHSSGFTPEIYFLTILKIWTFIYVAAMFSACGESFVRRTCSRVQSEGGTTSYRQHCVVSH